MAHERGPVLSGIAPTVLGMTQRRNTELLEQLTWHWTTQLRPRLDGLTDEEYLWEPVPGAWNVRPRGHARTEQFGGSGDVVVEFAYPEPTPAPLTTIAWRLAHVIVGVFGMRNGAHFGGPATSYGDHDYAATAKGALDQLDQQYELWVAGVRSLGEDGLDRPVGPAEGPWAESPYSELVLHINREVIHHGAEIALLRDLWAHGVR
jgi:DinB superfamily